MQRPYSHKGLSNKTTNWSTKRRREECRSSDSHLEWPPRIMGFIHARNVWLISVEFGKRTHKKNLVKAQKIIDDSVTNQLVLLVYSLKTPKMFWFLDQSIWREERKSEYDLKKPVEECVDPDCKDHAVIRVSQIKNNLKR